MQSQKSVIKNSYIYKILQLIYGELFNAKNKFSTRVMRVLCRTPIKNISYNIYKFFWKKKEKPIETFDSSNYFLNDLNQNIIYENLKKNGISLNIDLKPLIVDQIIENMSNFTLKVNRDIDKFIYLNEKKNGDGIYICRFFDPHKKISLINEIATNKKLVNAIKKYINTEPILHSSQIWWTFPYRDENGNLRNPPGNEFGYHYDVDDFKFLKLFFYLSDVDDTSGPHVYIKNNGKKSISEYLDRRIDDEVAEKKYKDKILKLIGKKGTGFIEDTSFYHKGTNPSSNNGRGILQVIYSISRW